MWSPQGETALTYLRNERHLSDEVIKQFQFGYCPRGQSHELAGRIIMPLFDPYGEIVAFTSRDPQAAKRFQHWHESFDKSSFVYGLNFAKNAIRKWDKAIIVEGQFDVACLHSYGFNMTIGVLGTSLSIMHIAQLSRYCSEIYLLFDPDESGDRSVERAIEMYHQYCLSMYGMQFIPVSIPSDPDDFVVGHGQKGLIDLMRQQKAWVADNGIQSVSNALKAKRSKNAT